MAGETTTDLVANVPLYTSKSVGQLVAQPFTVTLRTTDLALNDVTGVCKIPKDSTLLGFYLQTANLDSNGAEALVWSILVGATVAKAGITNAVAMVGSFIACASGPITVTADTIVYLKATTAAATAAAGAVNIVPIYITAS